MEIKKPACFEAAETPKEKKNCGTDLSIWFFIIRLD